MTPKEARETLPDVRVRVGTREYVGHTRGRLCDFAGVFVPDIPASIEYS